MVKIKRKFEKNPSDQTIKRLVNLYRSGHLEEAIEEAQALATQYPDTAIIWDCLGAANTRLRKFEEASEAFKKVVELRPDYAGGYNNLGVALNEQGRLKDAIESYKKSLSLEPNQAETYNNLANALNELGEPNEAIKAYNKALSIEPQYAIAQNNLGNVLKEQEKLVDAIRAYERAISINPNYAEAYSNMGNAFRDQGRLTEAVDSLKKALSINPNYAEGHYNLSLVYNLMGDLSQGLKLYEWRKKKKKSCPAREPREKLSWDGLEPIKGKRFLVYEEQGLGDIIQFARYLPMLEQLGAEVTFQVKTKMHSLLGTLSNNIKLTESFPAEQNIDFEAPLMSLPYLFGTSLNTIPAKRSYLSARPDKVDFWAKKLSADQFKIGICWQGSKNKIDVGRSFPLTLFEDIAKIKNVELVSLQKGEGEEQIQNIHFELTELGPNFDDHNSAFIDTAAVMKNCDLIITSDTSTAHLAGALGCPTWVAIKHIPEWRWLMKRTDSPWYPTITLFRQKRLGDWKSIFISMRHELASMVEKKRDFED